MFNRTEYMKAYYEKNREKLRAQHKAYYEQNREKIKAYREKNRDKLRAQIKACKETHPLYNVWTDLMMRCGHHKGASAKILANYAGRGITVCPEWQHLKTFEQWALANGWKKELQLDRIDNDKGYSPENCRFVTPKENVRNRRNTVKIRGVSLAEYYDAYANKEVLSYRTFFTRITKLHWLVEKALYTAVKH